MLGEMGTDMPMLHLSAGTLDYEEQGSGPAVVLLHGVLMGPSLWDRTLALLPPGFRYIRPLLPLGAHRQPMNAEADLSLAGQIRLLAEFLDALDLSDVALVHSDWGGGLLLTAYNLDRRIGRLIILPCEAFDNFPPGLPGRVAAAAARLPGGPALGARQLRIRWLRRSPLLLGAMAKRSIADELVYEWTEPMLRDKRIRRDFARYASGRHDRRLLIAQTEALRTFTGEALVLWSPENTVMPPEHGRRLADLLPRGRLMELDDAFVLSMLDRPGAVADAIGSFLVATRPTAV